MHRKIIWFLLLLPIWMLACLQSARLTPTSTAETTSTSAATVTPASRSEPVIFPDDPMSFLVVTPPMNQGGVTPEEPEKEEKE